MLQPAQTQTDYVFLLTNDSVKEIKLQVDRQFSCIFNINICFFLHLEFISEFFVTNCLINTRYADFQIIQPFDLIILKQKRH
jgi:hypothetical protein